MTSRRAHGIGRSLDTLFRVGALGTLSDADLLECVSSRQNSESEDAFRALVERHGPMVLGLCRSVVRNVHDAEDAFQATFLVLIRKASSIRRRDTIGPWLYGVAGRVARKARARRARRSRLERPLTEELTAPEDITGDCGAPLTIIQEEIARLPEQLRGPLVLCCVQGMSYEAAARSLGVTEPALRGRLHRARKRLAIQLRARGTRATALGASLDPSRFSLPSVSSSLVESTVHISVRWSSLCGLSAGSVAVSDSIATLAQGVIRIMLIQTCKLPAAGLLVAAGLVGTVVLAHQGSGRSDDRESRHRMPATAPSAQRDPREKSAPQPDVKALKKDIEEKYNAIDLDAKTRKIRERLKQVIEFDRNESVPLDQVLKRIKQATTDTTFPGIPIYVEPVGLQQANVTLRATVSVPKKGTVDFILSSVLRRCRLSYIVKDGFLEISSREDITERQLRDLDDKMERVLQTLERLERTAK